MPGDHRGQHEACVVDLGGVVVRGDLLAVPFGPVNRCRHGVDVIGGEKERIMPRQERWLMRMVDVGVFEHGGKLPLDPDDCVHIPAGAVHIQHQYAGLWMHQSLQASIEMVSEERRSSPIVSGVGHDQLVGPMVGLVCQLVLQPLRPVKRVCHRPRVSVRLVQHREILAGDLPHCPHVDVHQRCVLDMVVLQGTEHGTSVTASDH
mmetsp:Transcript_51178/g.91476  ORF Transcript_51178/g.91476 Transcript_51178/m.91476 type:complete len:205 (-) Transcript_51178:405-1019(-)